jgi:pimeloyl-ACP methyl ester carboxylesterase
MQRRPRWRTDDRRRLRHNGIPLRKDTTERLPQIAAPTLVIAGELDQGTPLAEKIPHASWPC